MENSPNEESPYFALRHERQVQKLSGMGDLMSDA